MPSRATQNPTVLFRGMRNVDDPARLGLGGEQGRRRTGWDWAKQATNVDLDDTQAYIQRRGQARVGEGGRNAFTTHNEEHLYLVRGSVLYHVDGALTQRPIRSGLTPEAPAQFIEVNERVYFTNGVDFLVLEGPHARDWGIPVPPQPGVIWEGNATNSTAPAGQYQFAVTYKASDGRESGASPIVVRTFEAGGLVGFDLPQHEDYQTLIYGGLADGQVLYRLGGTGRPVTWWNGQVDDTGPALRTQNRYPPPGGHVIGFFQGRVLLGQYIPDEDKSVIWQSDPLSYEHFDLFSSFMVPGEVRTMAAERSLLYIGTDRVIHARTPEGAITEALGYGVPRGAFANSADRGGIAIWTNRGLCVSSQEGLTNITEQAVSVPPGAAGSVAVVEQDGFRKALVTVRKDGQPHNVWES